MRNRRRPVSPISISFASFVAFVLALPIAPAASADAREVCFDVSLRGGKTEICADVHTNRRAPRFGSTVLAVHGLTETAAAWGPLTDAIFSDRRLRSRVRRVIAIDLPGHGDSPIPLDLPGTVFGDLTIDDNVDVLIQSIRALRRRGLGSRTIIGHSMGGLAIQGAQGVLLAQGSSLARLGVRRAILLAPVPAGGQRFTQPPPADLSPFLVTDPALGTFLLFSPEFAPFAGGYTRPDGTLAAGTPTPDEIAPKNGPEPLTTLLQLTDQLLPALPRPTVPEGGFALRNGTLLSVVSFSQDVLVQPDDLDDLYNYLIGGRGFLYRPIDDPEAVHSMFISDPEGLIRELRELRLMLQ